MYSWKIVLLFSWEFIKEIIICQLNEELQHCVEPVGNYNSFLIESYRVGNNYILFT